MTSKTLIFAGIMAGIIGNAYATGENTVTSKSYVDARDELKQNKIPATGTNASTPGDTVVTYTNTAGTIGERAIFDYNTGWDAENQEIVSGHEGDLVPAEEILPAVNNMYNDITNVNNSITNLTNQMNAETRESINVQLPLTCANSCAGLSGAAQKECEVTAGAQGGCTLWEIGSVGIAHKLYSCTAQTVATDCPACGTGTQKACENNICKCVKACIAQGSGTCSVVSDCCACAGTTVCEFGICGCNTK